MPRVHQTDDQDQTSGAGDITPFPLDSEYLTDGKTLFHVERTLVESRRGELLVELEDCAKLELIVCSARSVAELGMRPVKPLARATG
jgi:hypothetical protein